ncbi:hypothetical protein ACH5RR_030335 [Cinchona calisaya]|uniref:F-box domain-containing protein n=1 Tax=Cinchona calisaya TaxID=153742 RepID=A0ABD2YVN3_9GENT
MIEERSKRIAVEEAAEDRISNLPQNVIDHILDCMPIRDAARTIALSSKWRYIWAEYPNLVLNEQFAKEIKRNRCPLRFQVDYANIVNGMLLQHIGAISTFFLHFPEMSSILFSLNSGIDKWNIYSNIDHWMLLLSRKGVRKLTLQNSNPNPYRTPPYLFSCPELIYVNISKCIFRAPITSKCFAKLRALVLKEVTFEPAVLIFPQLVRLTLSNCSSIHLLNISTPLLEKLSLYDNDDFELSSYMNCKFLKSAYIARPNAVEHDRQDETINLTTILGCWPLLSTLYLGGSTLKFLTAGTVPERLPSTIKWLNKLVTFRISYDVDEIACILCLLRSSPSVSRLEISARRIINSDMKILDYLGEPGVMEQCTDRLKTVKMKYYKGTIAELLFVKVLLASSPSLERICVEVKKKLAPSESLNDDLELSYYLNCTHLRVASIWLSKVAETKRINFMKLLRSWSQILALFLDGYFLQVVMAATSSKRIAMEGCAPDRILSLPSNVIDRILACIPIRDAARTKYLKDIDQQMLFLSRQGLRELTLEFPKPIYCRIHSCIFSCPRVTKLNIFKCISKAPTTYEGFRMLTDLYLEQITFELSVLSIPKLVTLSIIRCQGTHHFIISAPKLTTLSLFDNDDLELSYYMNLNNLQFVYIMLSNGVEHHRQDERFNFMKLFKSWPQIRLLYLDGVFLKYAAAGCTIPERLPTAMLRFLTYVGIFSFTYDLDQMAFILCLLRSSNELCQLVISVDVIIHTDMEVVKYLEEPGLLKQSIGLKTVIMKGFRGSIAELLFVKLLLANSPSLS